MPRINSVMRIARPTDNLSTIAEMYEKGLGFKLLSSFENHAGFDGMILGHPRHNYHLEFTHHKGHLVGKSPTEDNLLVFYVPDPHEWEDACNMLEAANFKAVQSYNPYWDVEGRTFEDVDGYRIVIQNQVWDI